MSFQLFRAIGEKVNRIDFYGEQMYFYFFAHYVARTRNFKTGQCPGFPIGPKVAEENTSGMSPSERGKSPCPQIELSHLGRYVCVE